ncbi:MAG: sigma-70 family RNA polymerase sigma factor [Burkholderiales bacterium]
MTPEQNAALAALLARCALRDQRALAELYRQSSAKLFGVSLRICRREDWAEDVLQESFVNIWNHAGDYAAAKSAPMTWMTAIVRNRSLDWLRRPRELDGGEDFEDRAAAIATDEPGPLAQVLAGEDAQALAACLQGLDSSQRQSITLAFVNGLSHSELADRLREPLGTVKTWIRRGLLRLKACLEQAGTTGA